MATNTWIKISGVWKEVVSVWEKVGGVWKKDVIPKGNVGGVWKEFKVYATRIVFDSFDRADNATTLGTTETGQVWQKYGTTNVWGISNNQAYPVTPSYEEPVYVEAGVSNNVSFQVQMAQRTNGTQIFWRIVNATNHFSFENLTIYRTINGAYVSMGSILAPNSGDVIRVDLQGNTHTIFVNDVQRLTFSDATHVTGTKFGFSTNSATTRLDSFLIKVI